MNSLSLFLLGLSIPLRSVLQGDAPAFDFKSLGIVLAGISLGLIGIVMTGVMLWPTWAETVKDKLWMVIGGIVLIGVSGVIMTTLSV